MNKLLNIFKKVESYHDLILALFFFMAVMMMIIPLKDERVGGFGSSGKS